MVIYYVHSLNNFGISACPEICVPLSLVDLVGNDLDRRGEGSAVPSLALSSSASLSRLAILGLFLLIWDRFLVHRTGFSIGIQGHALLYYVDKLTYLLPFSSLLFIIEELKYNDY